MKIHCLYKMKFLNRLGIQAITLFPFILFADEPSDITEQLFRHELEHIYQVQKLGWFRFYSSYLKYYFAARFKGRNHHDAYFMIPYEVEARSSEKFQLSEQELALLRRKLKDSSV